MRGKYEGKTAEEVREDLLKVIRAAKAVRDSSFDFNDKYDELLRYGIYSDNNDTFKEERDERRKERIKLNMYDVRSLAKVLGKKVYFEKDNTRHFPYRGYFYFDDAEISAYYAEKELTEEDLNG